MPPNWNQLLQTLNSGLQFGNQLLPRQSQVMNPTTWQGTNPTMTAFGGLQLPNQLLGAGLLAGGIASDRTPGITKEAEQFLRNRFSSQTALSDQFTGQLGALNQQFQPLLTQQRQRGIADISQRFAAAFPKTVGAQGPEFGALSRYITDEALPREQGLLGDLGLKLLDYQGQAANTILGTNQQNPLSQLSSLLGYDLLTRGQGGQGGTSGLFGTGQGTGQAGTGGLGGLGNLLSSPQQLGQLNPSQLAQQLVQSGDLASLGQLISSGALRGLPFPTAIQASTPVGQLIQQGIKAGLVESPAATQLGGTAAAAGLDFGLPGAGLLGPAGVGSGTALLSAAGSGLGGAGAGYAIGSYLGPHNNQFTSAGGGALGGAAVGFAVGGPPGAVIGAIAGGIAGLFGASKAVHAQKSADTQREQAQTDQARPAVFQKINTATASFDTTATQLEDVATRYKPFMSTLVSAGDPQVRALDAEIDRAMKSLTGGYRGESGATILDILTDASGNLRNTKIVLTEPGTGEWSLGTLLQSGETGRFGPAARIVDERIQRANDMVELANKALSFARSRGFQG